MVREIVVAFDRLPQVPVMVTVTVPIAALLLAVNVKVLEPVAGFVPNDAVTPLGRPDADRLTLPLNPLCGVTVTVLVPPLPCMMLRLGWEEESVKFPVGFTVRVIVAVLEMLPDAP